MIVKAGYWLPNNIYIYINLNLYTNSNIFSSNCAPYISENIQHYWPFLRLFVTYMLYLRSLVKIYYCLLHVGLSIRSLSFLTLVTLIARYSSNHNYFILIYNENSFCIFIRE